MIARLNITPTAVVLNPFTTLEDKMSTIEAKLEAKHKQLTQLRNERAELLLAAVDGDAEAKKQVDRLDKHIGSVAAEISRLLDARDKLQEKKLAEQQAEATKVRKAEEDAALAAFQYMTAAAADFDATLRTLHQTLCRVADSRDELFRIAPYKALRDRLSGAVVKVSAVIDTRFASFGTKGAPVPSDIKSLSDYLPTPEEIITLIREGRLKKGVAD